MKPSTITREPRTRPALSAYCHAAESALKAGLETLSFGVQTKALAGGVGTAVHRVAPAEGLDTASVHSRISGWVILGAWSAPAGPLCCAACDCSWWKTTA